MAKLMSYLVYNEDDFNLFLPYYVERVVAPW